MSETVVFVAMTLPGGHRPIEEESVREMDRPHRHEHRDRQYRGSNERQRARDEQTAAAELDDSDE